MSLKIISPGMLTTLQDLGRAGYQKDGILVSGAMDAFALRAANLLVGNKEEEACLEITFLGPKIRFEADHLIALTGADLSAQLNGERVQLCRPVFAAQGSLLEFGAPRFGSRTYLAVSGGFAIPKVLGSYSTYLRAGIGGLQGRALKTGDLISCPGPTEAARRLLPELAATKSRQARWTPDPQLFPLISDNPVLHAVRGPEYDLFSAGSKDDFWQKEFIVTSDSDRMGYRLQGPALTRSEQKEILSSAVTFGTIQVPAEGNPIVLLADHQTTGGYPRIAQVITADFSALAQVPLGRKIRFREVTLEEAHYLYIKQEQDLLQIKRALQFKIKST